MRSMQLWYSYRKSSHGALARGVRRQQGRPGNKKGNDGHSDGDETPK